MKTIHEKALSDWVTNTIGQPYEVGASGPHAFDCWGLVVSFYKEIYDLDLPTFSGFNIHSLNNVSHLMHNESHSGRWLEIDKPENGCVVMMSKSKVFHHVGVFVNFAGLESVIHAFDQMHVISHSLQNLRRNGFTKIKYFRWQE
ncbi:C40 family peptidase [Akkermansiaceae bacterium]|nr:C40 family peptidase [Akkermansiaceae bacterium]